MTIAKTLLAFASCFILGISAPVASADGGDPPGPLFDSDQILNVRIISDFDFLAKERPTEEYVPGQFFFTADNGEVVELEVGIRARGRFRRRADVCEFPPLRLNFKKGQVKETLFAGQDKLKLVSHCTTDSYVYEQGVIAEYLAYRILNLMTDTSFRVRLLNVEYETPGGKSSFDGYGVLIEHKDNLAERLGILPIVVENTPVSSLDPDYLNLTSIFQYLIGNTDFSPITGSAGGECCHNHTLFGNEGEPYYSIPYDFDMAGFIDAPYAMPNPKLRLDSVLERLYRGRCVNNDLLPATVAAFNAKRDEIETMVREQPELSTRKRRDVLRYISKFYSSLSNQRGLDRNLISKCK
jgi:hypothetical protein